MSEDELLICRLIRSAYKFWNLGINCVGFLFRHCGLLLSQIHQYRYSSTIQKIELQPLIKIVIMSEFIDAIVIITPKPGKTADVGYWIALRTYL